MRNLVLAISLLFLVGCGGSSDSGNSPLATTDNSGNYHNNYGFYGSTVKLGNENIIGTYEAILSQNGVEVTAKDYPDDRLIYRFNTDGSLDSTVDGPSYDRLVQSFNSLGLDFDEADRWTKKGIYGVDKDGTKLKFDLSDKIYTESIYKGSERIQGNECLIFSLTEKDDYKMNLCKTSI